MVITPDILCDLDGTLVESIYPDMGVPLVKNIEKIKSYRKLGHRIVIYTTRSWWERDRIEKFLKEKCNLIPDAIICGKPLGLLVDDLSIDPCRDDEDLISMINTKVNYINQREAEKTKFKS